MRTISADLEVLLTKPFHRVNARAKIEDGDGTLQDVTSFKDNDWLISASIRDDVDAENASLELRLKRDIYNDSLAPLVKTTRTNLNSIASYDPLINLRRRITFAARYSAADEGAAADSWIEMFDGYIDDIDWGSDTIVVSARDKMSVLQDTFIETPDTYGSDLGTAVETVIQNILDDTLGGSAPTLYCPTSPSWLVYSFKTEKQSLADQIKTITDQFGWRCRYKYDSGTSSFRLTLYDPDRAKTSSDRTFSQDDYYDIPNITISTKDIRNAVSVKFGDTADLSDEGTPKKVTRTREDAGSIALYGRRWCGITEGASSNITSSTEADALADIILSDLAYPKMTKQVEMPFFAPVDLDDLYTFTANNVHYTDNTKFAVVGYQHNFSSDAITTTLNLHEESIIGQCTAWEYAFAEPGIASMHCEAVATIDAATVTPTVLGLHTAWSNPPLDGSPNSRVRSNTVYQVYVTAVGGTPATADMVGSTKSNSFTINVNDINVPAGAPVDVHIIPVTDGVPGTTTTIANQTALRVSAACIDPDSGVMLDVDGIQTQFQTQSQGASYPPDNIELETGSLSNATLDDGSIMTGVSPQAGNSFLYLN